MTERPMLFRPEMVRAYRWPVDPKTQTRRLSGLERINADPDAWAMAEPREKDPGVWMFTPWAASTPIEFIRCPYGVAGDRLKVIELRGIPGDGNSIYRAGSDGNIYSYSNGRTNSKKEKPFSLKAVRSPGTDGYPVVTIFRDGKRTTASVHVLICAAFHGPRPFDVAVVRHLDGNPDNSHPGNLQWGTYGENERDKRRHGTVQRGNSKLNEESADLIRRTYSIGLVTAQHLGEFYGVSQKSIFRVCSGDSWESITDEGELPAQAACIDDIAEVLSICPQRLQDISREDAIAEGIQVLPLQSADDPSAWWQSAPGKHQARTPQASYRKLIEDINGPDAWPKWVWKVEFRRLGAESRGMR